jgi:filamentation induced by cAMP protein fic
VNLLTRLLEEKESQLRGGIYHRTQIDFCYNSNHIEGSQLTHEQTRYILDTCLAAQDEYKALLKYFRVE